MSNIELSVVTRGNISGISKSEIVNTLKDCYKHFGDRVPYRVEMLITDTEAIMRDYLRQEKFKLGIIDEIEEDEVCLYDIWKKFPRITISVEKLNEYSKQARPGVIRHQAAHSILHGSLEYRIFKIPEDCQQVALVKNLDNSVLEQAVQKLSLAVKDCEASKLLVEHSFINCQIAFALEWIHPPSENKLTQKAVRPDRPTRFISQLMLLKAILFAHPLISVPKSKKVSLELQVMLGRRIEEIIQNLQPQEQTKLLQVASLIADGLTEDTHYNVDSALHQAMSLA